MAPRTSYFARETSRIDQSLEIGKQSKVRHFSPIMGNGLVSGCCSIGRAAVLAPGVLPGDGLIYNQYTLRVKRSDGLKKHLSDTQIGTEVYSFVPMRECFAYMGCGTEDCTESNHAAVLENAHYPKLSRIAPRATGAGPRLHCSLLSLMP
jgi:hypothetical protein